MRKLVYLSVVVCSLAVSAPCRAADSLVQTVSKQAGVTDVDAAKQIQGIFSAIEAELKAGHDVTVRNFGRFYVQRRDPRQARNPKTGASVAVPAKSYARFSSSDKLKESLNPIAAKQS